MATRTALLASITKDSLKADVPEFRPGDTVKVHVRIIEGNKERVQVFEGVVIKRHKGISPNATFTVRKVSYNVGVERTFLLHSPRIEQIVVISRGKVRRSRLFYLRDVRGKASRIKSRLEEVSDNTTETTAVASNGDVATGETPARKRKGKVDQGKADQSEKQSAPKSGAEASA